MNFFLLIIIFVCIINLLEYSEGFSKNPMFPLNSPFNQDFFKHTVKPLQIAVMPHHTDADFFSLIAPKAHSSCYPFKSDSDIIQQVNNRQQDFAVVAENSLAEETRSINNIRYVAKLFKGYVNILVPDQLYIMDISEVKSWSRIHNKTLKIDVGHENSVHHKSCMSVLGFLDLMDYVDLVYVNSTSETVKKYKNCQIDIVYRIGQHPMELFKLLTKKVQSHLVSIYQLNHGTYSNMNDFEKSFYDKNVTFHRAMIDLDIISPRMYPYMTILNRNSLYLPTISTNFMLITNDKVSDEKVQLLFTPLVKYIKREYDKKKPFMRGITLIDLSDSSLHIHFHPAVSKIFTRLGLHTDNNHSHCIYYLGGHCPAKAPKMFSYKPQKQKIVNYSDYVDKYLNTYAKGLST